MNRAPILILLALALFAGCQTMSGGGNPTVAREARVINAGPIANYAADGVYDRFSDQGFFVVRRGERLFVLSSNCTHRKCKLDAERDHSFYCSCHGSTFSPEGKVTEGPAKVDLPVLPAVTNELGQLLVTVPSLYP